MKSNIIKNLLLVALVTGLFSSCVNSDVYPTPATILTTYEFTSTKTVQEIIDVNNSSVPALYKGDDIIEGYVTSNDKESNFYNSISLQTIPTDGSAPVGFSVTANFRAFAEGFVPGRKTYIKLNGLYTAVVDGSLKIGALFDGGIGRISENEWQYHLFPSATLLDENKFVKTVSLDEAADDSKLNTLVELDNVQFVNSSLNRTYYDVNSGGGSTNHNIISTTGGTSRFFRVSNFAPFSKKEVASGSGKIRGVMTKYGKDYQFIVRDLNDVKLNNPRVTPLLNESFDDGLSNWIPYSVSGSQVWTASTTFGNPGACVKMSGFAGTSNANEDWLITTAQDLSLLSSATLTFETATKFTGNGLTVYISKNYSGSGNPASATWAPLTATFAPADSNYKWTPSGAVNIDAFTGPGNNAIYIAFKYTSTSSASATWEIDNVKITAN